MTCVCDNGWIEIDDMPHPCKKCVSVCEPIQDYVGRLATAMGLGDWTIEVQAVPADEGNLAEIDCVYGQRHGKLFVCEGWLSLPVETQRSTLVHELMHAHVSAWAQMLDDLGGVLLKGREKRTLVAALHLLEEYTVDAVALAWAPFLPLPRSKDSEEA